VRTSVSVGLLGLGLFLTACGKGSGGGYQAYDSPQSIASALGCTEVSTGPSGQNYDQETCTHGGARLSIWWQSRSSAAQVSGIPRWVHSAVGGSGWFVGCQRVADCEQVQRTIGGVLTAHG
jgi:hypothetical protein